MTYLNVINRRSDLKNGYLAFILLFFVSSCNSNLVAGVNNRNPQTITYYLNIADFANSFIQIPTSNLSGQSSTIASSYLAGRAPIYNSNNIPVGTCSASFLNMQTRDGKIYPIIGAGVGVSEILITNYRTTGLAPTGDSTPYKSFSAENQYTLRQNFTYTFLAGIEYNHDNSWAIETGYRWFNSGHFQGPRYQRVNDGSAVDVACDTWKMKFRANEWFIEFKIFI